VADVDATYGVVQNLGTRSGAPALQTNPSVGLRGSATMAVRPTQWV